MNIIFTKQYIDKTNFDKWIIISMGEEGFLVDEVTGRIEMTEGFEYTITLQGVPSSYYAPVREDVE